MTVLSPRRYHRRRLQKLVDNGPNPPPGETGAKHIIREDGRRVSLAVVKGDADRRLEPGDKVGGKGTQMTADGGGVARCCV